MIIAAVRRGQIIPYPVDQNFFQACNMTDYICIKMLNLLKYTLVYSLEFKTHTVSVVTLESALLYCEPII